jgi:hypothetical protein
MDPCCRLHTQPCHFLDSESQHRHLMVDDGCADGEKRLVEQQSPLARRLFRQRRASVKRSRLSKRARRREPSASRA